MKFSNLETQNKILLISFVVFLALYVLLTYRQKPRETKELVGKLETADTYIPAGHVLVPIEIENVESVSGIIGSFALVDLYTRPQQTTGSEMIMVAQKIKLIRAPLNPNQYAVLVTEAQSTELLKINPRFWVTIHNQKVTNSTVKVIAKTQINIAEEIKPLKRPKYKVEKKKAHVNDEIQIEYYDSKKVRYL